MADLYNEFPSWGEAGEYPSAGFFYDGGDQVNEKHLDALWNGVEKHVGNLNTAIRDRVRDFQGNAVIDTGLVASQGSGTREVDVTASDGAYVDGQFTGSVSATTVTHTSNGGTSTRTDVVWVNTNGSIGKTEDTTTTSTGRLKIAEVDVATDDTINAVRNYARDAVAHVSSENEPENTRDGDIWHDNTADRLKARQSGAYRALVTDQDEIRVSGGDGLKNGDAGDLVGGFTVVLDIEPADFAGEGVEDDGADNLRVDEDYAFSFTSDISFNSGISIATGESIEDGNGVNRLLFQSGATDLMNESGEVVLRANSTGTNFIFSRGQTTTVRDTTNTQDIINFNEGGLVDIPNGNLRISTGQSIESGDGTARLDINSNLTRLRDDAGSRLISGGSGSRVQVFSRQNEPFIIRDEQSATDAISYEPSSGVGTLLLNDATLDLNGNNVSAGEGRINNLFSASFRFGGWSADDVFDIQSRGADSAGALLSIEWEDASAGTQDRVIEFHSDGNVDLPNGNLDLSAGSKMSLPSVTADPTASAGDLWYRSDLD